MLDAGLAVTEFLEAHERGDAKTAAKRASALEEWLRVFDLPTSFRGCVLATKDEILNLIDFYI